MNTREETLPIRLSLRSDLTLYLLGEESVLFSRRSGRLYGLERTATVALLRLEEGEQPDALSHSLGLDSDSARVVGELASILAGEESCDNEYESELLFIGKPPDRPGARRVRQHT